jgi:type I restriction enzyme M protein
MAGAVYDLPDPAALFKAADILRGSVDAAEYKHLVLGLLFLKYVSESFEQRREVLRRELADPDSDEYVEDEAERAEMLDDKDEYVAENVFFIPVGARWSQSDRDPKRRRATQRRQASR